MYEAWMTSDTSQPHLTFHMFGRLALWPRSPRPCPSAAMFGCAVRRLCRARGGHSYSARQCCPALAGCCLADAVAAAVSPQRCPSLSVPMQSPLCRRRRVCMRGCWPMLLRRCRLQPTKPLCHVPNLLRPRPSCAKVWPLSLVPSIDASRIHPRRASSQCAFLYPSSVPSLRAHLWRPPCRLDSS